MITNLASSSAVSSFLPVIARDLHIPESQLQWLVSAFSLSSGCLLLLLGRLADLWGRKRFFVIGTSWLAVFSLGCGFARDSTTLYILRGLQGIGPAAFLPACVGILAHAFPESGARNIAFATFSAGAPMSGAVGTQISALLAQKTPASWRAPFYFLAGLSALCALGGLLAIDDDVPSLEMDKRVDWIGAFLVTTGLVLLLFVLGQGQLASQGWKTPYILALLFVGLLAIGLFLAWQHYLEQNSERSTRLPPPLMKLSLWSRANGKFAVMQVIAFFEWAGFLTWFFWSQVYYEDYVKLTPILTALRMLPMSIAGFLCNFFVVFLVSRVDLVYLVGMLELIHSRRSFKNAHVVFGTTFTGIAGLLMALIHPGAPYWTYGFPSPIVSVFGGDFVFAAGTLFIAKISLPHEQSLSGGIFQTLMQLGTAFGLAISTIVLTSVSGGRSAGMGAPLEAYHAAQWTAFGMAIGCSVLAIVFLRGVKPVGIPAEADVPEESSVDESVKS